MPCEGRGPWKQRYTERWNKGLNESTVVSRFGLT
jgi:hypothetical protein